MITRIGCIALVLAALGLAHHDLQPAAAQSASRLDLVAQTTFVGADPAVIDVRVLGAPTEAVLNVRIHEAITTRPGLLDSIEGTPPTDVIGQWVVDDLDAARIGAGDVLSIQVPDEEIGELLRRPTDAGPHPVVIELAAAGTVLDSLVTHLLVVPPEDEADPLPRLTVALLFDLRQPLSLEPDGTSTVDPVELERATTLAAALTTRVELPLTVQLPVETFEALDALGLEAQSDTLRAAAVGNSVLRAPWVEVDEESWRAAGRADLVAEVYQVGAAVMETTARISTGSVIRLDRTAGPATISMLTTGRIDATGFVLDPDGVVGVPGDPIGPVIVSDEEGIPFPAVMPDSLLASLATGPDPELAVQHTLAELLRIALTTGRDRAGVVIAPGAMDLVALDLILDGLDQQSPLVPGTIEDVLALPFDELVPGQRIEARLTPDPPEDLADHVARRGAIERRLDAYASILSNDVGIIEPLRTTLLASVAESVSESRDDYLAYVEERVDAGLSGVELVDTGRITITSRRAELPVTINNDQTLPITAVLALSAEKIGFPGGERQVHVLQPGQNVISLEVEALASGDSTINLRIESPEGAVELASGVVRLRSTAISGLGLLISMVALAVLVGWWIQTIRRRRRARREPADSVAGSPGVPDDEAPVPTTDDGESP